MTSEHEALKQRIIERARSQHPAQPEEQSDAVRARRIERRQREAEGDPFKPLPPLSIGDQDG